MSSQSGEVDVPKERSLCDGLEGEYSMGLHVAAIFIVSASSFLGTVTPLITKYIPFLRSNPFVFVIFKTAATGVLLSVSTIHLIAPAIEAIDEPCVPKGLHDFYEPYGFFLVALAALMMHAVDFKMNDIALKWMKKDQKSLAPEGGEEDPPQRSYGTLTKDEVQNRDAEEDSPECGHSHGGVLPPPSMGQLRRIIAAVSMEFGVTLHSIFVGLDMGLTTDASLKPLLVALVFHQLFEGMALGSRLVDARFSIVLDIIFSIVFSVSAPLGMSISTIAVSIRKDAMAGGGFALMLGSLSSFCGGILLYLAFNQLFSDFMIEIKAHCSDGMPMRTTKKVVMFVSLWSGMLTMAIIGKWL
ncbi:unnamed protein product [Phytomonas sp. EM1]|nr:unnamed protein product [Phytomonas sp. EM1]|eukprot:CCW65195.1 unnamed protein product [Phytomonas sp. isolate EM1]